MRNPGGFLICEDVSGRVEERDTFTCGHCNGIVVVGPRSDPADMGGRCYICDSLVCPRCHAKGVCVPLEENLRRLEASYHARRSYGF
ncbi:MAG: hypothetical protein Rhirs2KO_18530 [Rhizobiaceae bacterium]